MNTETVSFKDGHLDIDVANYLSRHDLVYLTPATEGYEGFQIGNGDMGAMAWTPPDRIHFQINKCDTWDDAPPGPFSAWEDAKDPDKAERFTALRSCGELTITPGLPVFDWMYLDDFEGRLALGDAQASWLAKGPLGEVECRAFVARDPAVLAVHYRDRLSEAVTRRVDLARWGSRVFEHWYAMIRREFLLGPAGTKAGCDGDEVWIEQPTRSLRFAMACKLSGARAVATVRNSRLAGFDLETGKTCEFTLFLATATSEETDDPLSAARAKIRVASQEGLAPVFERHRRYWFDFWSRSFVDLPDDYLTNLWYLNGYQVGSSSLGKYPPHFIGSLWSWNRDARPWNHYYHWNQQQYTWPLHASGHHELMRPYAAWRLEGLPRAVEDASNIHRCQGAFYADVANRKGWQGVLQGDGGIYDVDIAYNLTPGPQIALDLWRHYQYTLDEEFLQTCAYPVMRECVRFYLDYLKKEDDGRYHVPKSSPYETWLRCRDTTSDLAHVRKLFRVFVDNAGRFGWDKALTDRAGQVLDKLADFVHTEIPEGTIIEGTPQPRAIVMSCGIDLDTGKPAYVGYRGQEGQIAQGHVANAQLAPIFPSGLVGLDAEGTEEFEVLKNTLRCLDPIGAHGHGVTPICLARMGLSESMESVLREWCDHYQLFPQGLFCYFRRDYKSLLEKGLYGNAHSASEHTVVGLTNNVRILAGQTDECVPLPKSPFAHMGLEAGSVLETAIDEMLLQSYSGKIRVFPAMPAEWSGTFKLHAVGGFVVTSERRNAQVLYVAVESKRGAKCVVVNPWEEGEPVRVRDVTEGRDVCSGKRREIVFDTRKDHVYLLERVACPMDSFKHETITGKRNRKPKQCGRAVLGKARQF